ncbi:MAG: STAS domain-containing protein [Pseudonocardia sp.]|nr:STAS domain-containing protein [Pseudonocardia sp.]
MFEPPEVPLRPQWLGTSPDDAVIVKVQGEIDLLTAPGLARRLTAACVGTARHVLVDLSTVEFLGAAGIQALVDAHRLCARRGIRFGLLNPSSHVLRPLKLLGLDHTIPIHSRLYERSP